METIYLKSLRFSFATGSIVFKDYGQKTKCQLLITPARDAVPTWRTADNPKSRDILPNNWLVLRKNIKMKKDKGCAPDERKGKRQDNSRQHMVLD